jgi:hypothetical protein
VTGDTKTDKSILEAYKTRIVHKTDHSCMTSYRFREVQSHNIVAGLRNWNIQQEWPIAAQSLREIPIRTIDSINACSSNGVTCTVHVELFADGENIRPPDFAVAVCPCLVASNVDPGIRLRLRS